MSGKSKEAEPERTGFDEQPYVEGDNTEEYPGNKIVDSNAGEDAADGGVAKVDDAEVRKSL